MTDNSVAAARGGNGIVSVESEHQNAIIVRIRHEQVMMHRIKGDAFRAGEPEGIRTGGAIIGRVGVVIRRRVRGRAGELPEEVKGVFTIIEDSMGRPHAHQQDHERHQGKGAIDARGPRRPYGTGQEVEMDHRLG
jgi:hypothetical protein